MRWLGSFACVVLVACGGTDADVSIVVIDQSGQPLDTVQLVVGKRASEELVWITPAGMDARSGYVATSVISSFVKPITPGGRVEFALDLAGYQQLDLVAAIAGIGASRNADGERFVATPTASAVRVRVRKLEGDEYTKYELVLEAAEDATQAPDAISQVRLWSNAGPPDRCVYLQNNRDSYKPATIAGLDATGDGRVDAADDDALRGLFIVPDTNDVDCDGFAKTDPLECTSDVFMDTRGPGLAEVKCLTGSGGSGCRLGGPGCVDGRPPDPAACDPSHYCAPPLACNSCADVECVKDLAATSGFSGLLLKCEVFAPYDVEAGAETAVACTSEATVAIPSGGRACTFIVGSARGSGFGAELVWNNLGATLSNAGCDLTLSARGSFLIPQTMTSVVRAAAIAVDFDDGSGLAIPALFKFTTLAVDATTLPTACDETANKIHCEPLAPLPAELESCLVDAAP
ncbi:MAG TPA: hypothetical protein VM513_20740 [Kofleriaceae bacterium]|nr:hypothetical protein [Kofleriaceae bacterium]